MAVHAGAPTGQQDRAGGSVVDGPFDGAADGGRERHEDDLVALAAHSQHAVAVLLAEVLDVATCGLEDPEPQ